MATFKFVLSTHCWLATRATRIFFTHLHETCTSSSRKKKVPALLRTPLNLHVQQLGLFQNHWQFPRFFSILNFSRFVKTPSKLVAGLNFCNFTLGIATQQKKTSWAVFFCFFHRCLHNSPSCFHQFRLLKRHM